MAKKSNTTKYLLIAGIAVAAYLFLKPGASIMPEATSAPSNIDASKVQAWISGETNPINQVAMQAYVATLNAADLHRLAQYYDYVKSGYSIPVPQDVTNFIANISNLGVGFHA